VKVIILEFEMVVGLILKLEVICGEELDERKN
jgi:hypothetical protein